MQVVVVLEFAPGRHSGGAVILRGVWPQEGFSAPPAKLQPWNIQAQITAEVGADLREQDCGLIYAIDSIWPAWAADDDPVNLSE